MFTGLPAAVSHTAELWLMFSAVEVMQDTDAWFCQKAQPASKLH